MFTCYTIWRSECLTQTKPGVSNIARGRQAALPTEPVEYSKRATAMHHIRREFLTGNRNSKSLKGISMELEIGMTRVGLRKLAHDILAQCESKGTVEVIRYITPNRTGDSELTLTLGNTDMEDREDIHEDTAYWDMARENATT
jgi:hypothetical protein